MSGLLFIVSAPSGAGKTSLVGALLAADSSVKLSISHTTRPPRPGEVDGRNYHFVTRPDFEAMLARAEFLESALVHGNYYGTSQGWIDAQRAAGSDILLEIDWQGAQQVRRRMPGAVGIFILPPSLAVLEERLRGRGQDSPGVIASRLQAARAEIEHANEYDYVIINNHFDDACADLRAIVRAARLTTASQVARNARLFEF